jgi:hypothetical protein
MTEQQATVDRRLAALQVHPVIDTLFTGLLLVGGAERTEAQLKVVGARTGPDAGKDTSKPVEITGRLVLQDKTRDLGESNKRLTEFRVCAIDFPN